MCQIEKVDENNRHRVIDLIQVDIIRNVFAFYDIQHDPEHTTMYTACEDDTLKGYILIYTALEFPSVILECDKSASEKLLDYAPRNCFIAHAPLNLLPIIENRFPNAKHYVENWMLVKRNEANFFRSTLVRRLCGSEDATKLATLLSSREDRPTGTIKTYLNWVSKMPMYGVFIDDELVAYACSFLQLPQVWMIGGVYTYRNHRNKGYATLAISAITEEALKNADSAALFVRSDNYPAIRAYEKIGYRKIGEKLWVDVGTGLKP